MGICIAKPAVDESTTHVHVESIVNSETQSIQPIGKDSVDTSYNPQLELNYFVPPVDKTDQDSFVNVAEDDGLP